MAIIIGTPNNDKKIGSSQADTLSGLDGNDTLIGQTGNDVLKGDSGADSLDGGTGNDQLFGGSGDDVLLGGSGNDVLNGEDGNDTLLGGAGADTLDGGTGADTLQGGDGNDLYRIDNNGDRIAETATLQSTDSVLSTISFTLPDLVENLQLLGDSNLSATGNALKNRISGNGADNELQGMDGQDTLVGGEGADTLDGGSGADSLVGGADDDTYLIGNNEDKIIETADGGDSDRIVSSISYSLIRYVESLTLIGASNLRGDGNEADNLLEGNSGANDLSGNLGNDTLLGNDGDDALTGGNGDDELNGGIGKDTAIYADPLEGYQLSFDDESLSWTITDIDTRNGDEGTDTLTAIEQARFADTTLNLSAKPILTVADLTQTEGTGTTDTLFNFIFNLSEASPLPVSVDYTLQPNTAEATTDVIARTGTLTFEPGIIRQTLAIPVKADNLDENNETFTLALSNIVGGTLAKTQITGTIIDDDTALISGSSMTAFTEGDSGSTYAVVSVTLSTPASQVIQVDYFTVNGTAKANLDYTAMTGTLSFTPGTTRQDILIPILGETLDETDENLTLVLARPQNARLDTATSRITVNILDNDPTPTLTVIPLTLFEGNVGRQPTAVTVALSNPSAEAVTVDYTTVNETAQAGLDYLASTGSLRFAPGETTKTLNIPVLGDTLNEADKTLGLTLSNLQNAKLTTATIPAAITIKNDDPLPVLSISPLTVTEGHSGTTSVTLDVLLSEISGQTVTVAYATANDTASASMDYTATSGILTFAPGITRQTITLSVLGDTLYEPDETFSVALSNPQNASLDAVSAALITLTNDDAPPLLSIGSLTVAEGSTATANTTLTLTLSSASYQTISVDYTTSDGTATAGKDYTAQSGTLTFAPGETRKTLSIPVVGDTLYETDETLTVSLNTPQNATLDPVASIATLTLQNDDAIPSLSVANAKVTEGNNDSSNLTLTLTLSVASALTTSVDYATVNGTALAGSDFIATSGRVEFAPGETQKSVTIPVLADILYELDETFTLSLSNPYNALVSSTAGVAVLTLANDDAQPSLSLTNIQVSEGQSGNNSAAMTASISAPSGLPVTVKYTTRDGTALAGKDYTATTGTLTFNPGTTTQQISLPIAGDTLNEVDENFTVSLSDPQNATLSTAASATVTLLNDDAVPTLSIAHSSVSEGNTGTTNAELTVTLSSASGQSISVNYATMEGSATAGKDYTLQAGSLTFTPGETVKTLLIPIVGDSLNEQDETFTVTLNNERNAILDTAHATATVSIKNDDPLPSLSVTTASLNEGQSGTSNATVTVSLSAVSGQTVTVSYATANGTAQDSSDYTALSGSLVFAPGETSKTLNVAIISDLLNEADETFTLALSSPQNANLDSAGGKATVTIKNDDAVPVLSIANARVTEGSDGVTQASVIVSLSAASGQSVTASYVTADGSAKAGSDYTSQTGTVSFAPGETSKTVNIPVQGDTEVESDETFTLALTAPQNATLNSTASKATVTIVNDDIALPVLTVADSEITEGDSGSRELVVTATLSTLFDKEVTARYTTQDDTATANNDYTPQSGMLRFAPGITSQTFTLPVLGDTEQEASEYFKLVLSEVQNAKLSTAYSLMVITNDDATGITFDGFDISLTDAADSLPGSYRNDRIDGLAGNDTLSGGNGTDLLIGGLGQDVIDGGEGNNTLDGGLGNDTITAGSGGDLIRAGLGNDSVYSGAGANTVYGGIGADTITGGSGTNWLEAGEGDDVITSIGADTILGGEGSDTIRHPQNNYPILVDAGEGNDTIYGGGAYSSSSSTQYNYYNYYSRYSSYYIGIGANDTFLGGQGNDVIGINLYSGNGSDNTTWLEAGEFGNDSMDGGTGNDTLYGGGGNDTLIGGVGADVLWGDGYQSGVNDKAGDRFVFNLGDSGVGSGNRDSIQDFDEPSASEVIDLSNLSVTGLSYKKTAPFDAANQVRYTLDTAHNLTIVQINLDADTRTSEMEIELVGLIPLNTTEFVLTAPVS